MEITIGSIKLTIGETFRQVGGGKEIYINIEVLGDFTGSGKPIPKVKASELKAAIEALEKAAEI